MKLHWLLPTIQGIPVLMYHRVWPGLSDGLTVTPEQLAEQWNFLKQEGYEAISLENFLAIAKGSIPLSGRKVLLTFDDGYQNNLLYVYPLLKQLNWKATFFIIGDTLEGHVREGDSLNRKLSVDELKQLDPSIVQLAMHGYHHENFKNSTLEEIQAALLKSIRIFKDSEVPLHPSVAYPYGARPNGQNRFDSLKKWMNQNKIEAGFRIGNQVAKVPTPDIYEIKRIDIRGTDTMNDFKIKLRKGKLKPF